MVQLFDPISPIGHKDYDLGILNACLRLGSVEVYLYGLESYPTFCSTGQLKVHRVLAHDANSRLESFKVHYQFLKKSQQDKKISMFLSFDNLSMLCACLLVRKQHPVYLICHNNLQRASTSSWSKRCLKLLRFFNIKLVLLEEIFADYAQNSLHYLSKQFTVLKYPLQCLKPEELSPVKPEKYVITYLSGAALKKGYDIFLQAVQYYFKNLKDASHRLEFKIILGKTIDFVSIGVDLAFLSQYPVSIYSHYISDQEYLDLLKNSSYVCLPFRSEFRHTCSNVLFEALAYNVPFITSSIDLFSFYHQTYGSIGEIFESENSQALAYIFKKIAQTSDSITYPGRQNMLAAYSPQVIQENLKNLINQAKQP